MAECSANFRTKQNLDPSAANQDKNSEWGLIHRIQEHTNVSAVPVTIHRKRRWKSHPTSNKKKIKKHELEGLEFINFDTEIKHKMNSEMHPAYSETDVNEFPLESEKDDDDMHPENSSRRFKEYMAMEEMRGSVTLTDIDGLSSCSSNESHLSDLDVPHDTSIITVRKLTKHITNGKALTLYHLFSGVLIDSINQSEGQYTVATENLNNHDLYDVIKAQSGVDLSSAGVTKEKQEKLYKESPRFVVTSTMPTYEDGIIILNTIKPEVETRNSKEVYLYCHPDDATMRVVVKEPNSPAGVDYEIDQSTSVPSNTAYCEERTYTKTKNELLHEQGKVLQKITKVYNQPDCHDEHSCVSILISAFKSVGQPGVRTIVHLIKGIIMPSSDKAAYHEGKVKDYVWITTLHWFNSPTLVDLLRDECQGVTLLEMNSHESRFARDEIPIAKLFRENGWYNICTRQSQACQDESFTIVMSTFYERVTLEVDHGITLNVELNGKSGSTDTKMSTKYKFEYQIGSLKDLSFTQHWEQELRTCLSNVPMSQSGSNGSIRVDQSVHFSFHIVKSMLKKAKGQLKVGSLQTTAFAIAALGKPPPISLPASFVHQDALNSWRSVGSSESQNYGWVQMINKYWGENQMKGKSMAPYILFFRKGGKFEPLEHQIIGTRADLVLMGKKGKCLPLDIKSHNPDLDSLKRHLENCTTHLDRFQEILNENPELSDKDISVNGKFGLLYQEICDRLPMSYQFPTIGIMHKLLPKPNSLGSNAQLVHLHEDKAHIRFSQDGQVPRVPSKEQVAKVLIGLCR